MAREYIHATYMRRNQMANKNIKMFNLTVNQEYINQNK